MYSPLWRAVDGAHATKRFEGRLDIRTPEDVFATDDQVQERYRRPVEAQRLEGSVAALLRAWQEGDRSRGAEAADELQRETRAHFQSRGVPVFAHPIVPPQLAQSAHHLVSDLPHGERATALNDLIKHFKQDLQPGIAQELALAKRFAIDEGDERSTASAQLELPANALLSGKAPRDQETPAVRPDWDPFESDSKSEDMTSANRTRLSDDEERLNDYNGGNVAKTVDDAIAAADWWERIRGRAGMQVKGKGRYIWTRFGWVDLQHVISAATTTDDPLLNLLLGASFEGLQALDRKYWESVFRKEDLLSNWVGAQALARQRLVGGTIGEAVAYVLRFYAPVSQNEARRFLKSGRKAQKWPYPDLGF